MDKDGITATKAKRAGRPRKTRTEWIPKGVDELDANEVYRMALEGCSIQIIADKLDTTDDIVSYHFERELIKARAERKEKLFGKQWELATVKGDRTMLIWLGKQELGQTDKQIIENTFEDFEVVIGTTNANSKPAAGTSEVLEQQGPS